MRHGDTKTEFSTGAKRDTAEGKGRPSLISPVLIYRLGVHLEEGAKHYGDDNWAKGMPYRRTADSIIRHIVQWLSCDAKEDHLAAIAFGVMCLMTYESQGRYDLDDRCPQLKDILDQFLTLPPGETKIANKEGAPTRIDRIRIEEAAQPQGAAEPAIGQQSLHDDHRYKYTGIRYGTA